MAFLHLFFFTSTLACVRAKQKRIFRANIFPRRELCSSFRNVCSKHVEFITCSNFFVICLPRMARTRVIIIWLPFPFPSSCVSCNKFFLIAFRPKKSSTCDHLLIKREQRYEYKFSRKCVSGKTLKSITSCL